MTIINLDLGIHFDNTSVEILECDGVVIERVNRINNLYKIIAYVENFGVSTTKLWHEIFGHISLLPIKYM